MDSSGYRHPQQRDDAEGVENRMHPRLRRHEVDLDRTPEHSVENGGSPSPPHVLQDDWQWASTPLHSRAPSFSPDSSIFLESVHSSCASLAVPHRQASAWG